LFADIRGFTRLAESLAPQVVVGVLNTYFSTLTKIAHHHEGTIFNMAGDSLLVGFNVPFEQPDASVRALSTGIDMIAHFSELAEQWQRQHNIAVGLGVGVDQGDVVVGNVGSSAYMNYTVIGDAVNVAARLVQLAAPGELLLSERLRPALGGLYPRLSLSLREDFVQIKGKIAPQRVFRIRPGSNL
jgi:adenylate cyclase